MKKRALLLSPLIAALVFAAPLPVQAGPAKDLRRELLHCTARGSALHSWFYRDLWLDLRATGTCTGSSGGILAVTVTGEGEDNFDNTTGGTRELELVVRLRNGAGVERVTAQRWTGVLTSPSLVRRRTGSLADDTPIGVGRATLGTDSGDYGDPVSLNWRFLAPLWG